MAIIRVGGATEIDMKSRKDLVDDALHATRCAAKEGYVPGGGVALIRVIDAVLEAKKKAKGDEKLGYDIIAAACESCCKQIAVNAGYDGDIVVAKVREGADSTGKGSRKPEVGFGFNAATGEYVDLVKAGIIDPALVAKTALLNAASVAGLMLTTDAMVAELKDEKEATAGAVS